MQNGQVVELLINPTTLTSSGHVAGPPDQKLEVVTTPINPPQPPLKENKDEKTQALSSTETVSVVVEPVPTTPATDKQKDKQASEEHKDSKKGPKPPPKKLTYVRLTELTIVGPVPGGVNDSDGDHSFKHPSYFVLYRDEMYVLKICEHNSRAKVEWISGLLGHVIDPESEPVTKLVNDQQGTYRQGFHVMSKFIPNMELLDKIINKEHSLRGKLESLCCGAVSIKERIANGEVTGLGRVMSLADLKMDSDKKPGNMGKISKKNEQKHAGSAEEKSKTATERLVGFDSEQCNSMEWYDSESEAEFTWRDWLYSPFLRDFTPYHRIDYIIAKRRNRTFSCPLADASTIKQKSYQMEYCANHLKGALFNSILGLFINTCCGTDPLLLQNNSTFQKLIKGVFEKRVMQILKAGLSVQDARTFMATQMEPLIDDLIKNFTDFDEPDGVPFIERCPDNLRDILVASMKSIQDRLNDESIPIYDLEITPLPPVTFRQRTADFITDNYCKIMFSLVLCGLATTAYLPGHYKGNFSMQGDTDATQVGGDLGISYAALIALVLFVARLLKCDRQDERIYHSYDVRLITVRPARYDEKEESSPAPAPSQESKTEVDQPAAPKAGLSDPHRAGAKHFAADSPVHAKPSKERRLSLPDLRKPADAVSLNRRHSLA